MNMTDRYFLQNVQFPTLLIHVFCKTCEHEIALRECQMQNKHNLRFTTLTKHVNNQTNCCITLEKLKKIWLCLVFIYLNKKQLIEKLNLTFYIILGLHHACRGRGCTDCCSRRMLQCPCY